MQKFWKSVKIWQSYTEFKGGNLYDTQCMYGIAWKTYKWILLTQNINTIKNNQTTYYINNDASNENITILNTLDEISHWQTKHCI